VFKDASTNTMNRRMREMFLFNYAYSLFKLNGNDQKAREIWRDQITQEDNFVMIAQFNVSALILYYELSHIKNFVSLIDFEVMIKCAKHFDIAMQRLMVLVKSKVLSGGIKVEVP